MKVITMVQSKNHFWNKKTFTLRKNGGDRISSLGGRSFPVVRQTGRSTKISLFKKILKLCNSSSNLFLDV